MFFPSLENLKKHDSQISDLEIKTFDSWLGTRPEYTWEYLNPLQFSIDCKFSNERSLNLFLASTHFKDIKLFNVRFVYKCPNCASPLIVEYDNPIANLKDNYCEDCERGINSRRLKESSTVYFSLQQEPVPPKSPPFPISSISGGEAVTKLSLEKFNEANNSFMNQFLTDF